MSLAAIPLTGTTEVRENKHEGFRKSLYWNFVPYLRFCSDYPSASKQEVQRRWQLLRQIATGALNLDLCVKPEVRDTRLRAKRISYESPERVMYLCIGWGPMHPKVLEIHHSPRVTTTLSASTISNSKSQAGRL